MTGKCNCPLSSSLIYCDCNRDLNNEYYWNGASCQQSISYGQQCSNSTTSYMCQTLTQGTICASSGSTFSCQCPTLQYFNLFSNKCMNQVTFNGSCNATITDMCQLSYGLSCLIGTCKLV